MSRVWIPRQDYATLSNSSGAWTDLLADASLQLGNGVGQIKVDLSNQDSKANVVTLAKAFAFARTGTESYRTDVRSACMQAINSPLGRTLALGRELPAYIIAADIVGLEPAEEVVFRSWIRDVKGRVLEGLTLITTHELRPNNWGTHAGAARLAIAIYLDDQEEIDRCWVIFRGWCGDRAIYSGFAFGDLSWQANSSTPVPINPASATLIVANRDGSTAIARSVDGALPEEMRRAGQPIYPWPKENYAYEALQGAAVQAVMLQGLGYPAWTYQSAALKRAFLWLASNTFHDNASAASMGTTTFVAEGDDLFLPWLANYYTSAGLGTVTPCKYGKNMGYTDWTHAAYRGHRGGPVQDRD